MKVWVIETVVEGKLWSTEVFASRAAAAASLPAGLEVAIQATYFKAEQNGVRYLGFEADVEGVKSPAVPEYLEDVWPGIDIRHDTDGVPVVDFGEGGPLLTLEDLSLLMDALEGWQEGSC